MLVNPPTSGTVAEIVEDKLGRAGEGVVAVVDGDQDAGVPESNKVARSIASHIGDETDMFFDTPPCVVTEVFDRGEGLHSEAVTEYNDPIEPKAYDISTTCARDGDWVIE